MFLIACKSFKLTIVSEKVDLNLAVPKKRNEMNLEGHFILFGLISPVLCVRMKKSALLAPNATKEDPVRTARDLGTLADPADDNSVPFAGYIAGLVTLFAFMIAFFARSMVMEWRKSTCFVAEEGEMEQQVRKKEEEEEVAEEEERPPLLGEEREHLYGEEFLDWPVGEDLREPAPMELQQPGEIEPSWETNLDDLVEVNLEESDVRNVQSMHSTELMMLSDEVPEQKIIKQPDEMLERKKKDPGLDIDEEPVAATWRGEVPWVAQDRKWKVFAQDDEF
jgi:hypothetical protein